MPSIDARCSLDAKVQAIHDRVIEVALESPADLELLALAMRARQLEDGPEVLDEHGLHRDVVVIN